MNGKMQLNDISVLLIWFWQVNTDELKIDFIHILSCLMPISP